VQRRVAGCAARGLDSPKGQKRANLLLIRLVAGVLYGYMKSKNIANKRDFLFQILTGLKLLAWQTII
jgi:hypothetical protein